MTPFDPPFSGSIKPPDVPPDPTGDEWRGEPGPPGPPGADGAQGAQGAPGPPGGLAEAPVDGASYGRLNAAWAQVYPASNPSGYQTAGQVAAAYVPLSQKAAANGVATLDATGRVPTSQLPASATGTLTYLGGWNASTNTPTLASGALANGALVPANGYYLVSVGGSTSVDGTSTWVAGDWAVSNGSVWQRVQNSTSPYLPLTGGSLSGIVVGVGFQLNNDTWTNKGYSPDIVWSLRDTSGNIPVALLTDGTLAIAKVPTPTNANMPASKGYVDTNFLGSAGGTVNGPAIFNAPVTLPALARFFSPPEGGFAFSIRDTAGNVAFGVDTEGNTIIAAVTIIKGGAVSNPPFILPTSPGPSGTWWNNGTFICVVP